MNKRSRRLLSTMGLLMGLTISQGSLAQNLVFEESFERSASDILIDFFSQNVHEVEISYEHANHDTNANTQGIGMGVGFSVYSACNAGLGDCREGERDVRFGEVQAKAHLILPNGERGAQVELSNLKMSMVKWRGLNGAEMAVVSLAYQERDEVKVIDFEVPLELLTVSKKIDFHLTDSGALKMYLRPGLSIGPKLYRHNSNASTQMMSDFAMGGTIRVEAGLQIFNRLDFAAHYAHSFESINQQSVLTQKYGADAAFQIADGLSITSSYTRNSVGFSGHKDVVRNEKLLSPKVGPTEEKFWQFGAGIKFEF